MRSGVYETVLRPSVRPIRPPHAAAAARFAAVGPAFQSLAGRWSASAAARRLAAAGVVS